jgi:glycine/D-amino acid oxidase-like deaminating enzyme
MRSPSVANIHPFPSPVLVIGAGCTGLSVAVELLERGHHVLLLAERLPGDALNPRYASSAAGAHHLSFAANDDYRQRFFDMSTFDQLWKESEDAEVASKIGLMRLTQTEL